MASTSARNNGEKKDSWPSQAAAALGGGQKVSLTQSEEFLSQISAELTDEALFIARSQVNSVHTKEMQTKDQGTQIPSKHMIFTKTRSTDTRSDRNRSRTMAHLLPSPREKGVLPNSLMTGR
ncbi:putative protein T-ENOL isoform X2 [Microtus pennsylvanicus]